jgi:3-hydroxyacyl-CoA dehydrogenase
MYEGVAKVAVLGTGTIGASWAAYFLSRGLEVSASDPAPDAEPLLHRFVETAWPALEQLGLAPGANRQRLSFHRDPVAAVAGCGFVQENGPERLEIKQELFARIGAALGPEVLIASSSSYLVPSRMQERCPHPERLVLGHPFNPPHLIPLVEVCGGVQTAPEAVDRAVAFYRAVGKHPIRLNKEFPGHVSNRLQSAIWREAAYLVQQGVVSVADVDAALCQGPGIRWALMGPMLTFHLAGGPGGLRYFLDHLNPARLWPELGTPSFTPEFEQTLMDGVQEEVGGTSIAELAQWRDRTLLGVLKELAASPSPAAGGGRS